MRASPADSSGGSPTAGAPPISAEEVAHFARTPGRVDISLRGLDSLFERSSPPTYPHTGPMVNEAVASFLVDSVRTHRRSPQVEVAVAFQCPPLRSDEEAGARAQVSHFFANEAELAELELRVNRGEGLASARFAIPFVLVAGLVAGLLYSNTWGTRPADYLVALVYLAFITVVWVLLWDPVEKILFDGYFIRQRIRALRKLAAARIIFIYSAEPTRPPGSDRA